MFALTLFFTFVYAVLVNANVFGTPGAASAITEGAAVPSGFAAPNGYGYPSPAISKPSNSTSTSTSAITTEANTDDLISTSSSTSESSSSSAETGPSILTPVVHSSANNTGFPLPTGRIFPTGIIYPTIRIRPTGLFPPRITTVPLVSVSGGYVPINHNFSVPYFNPHCPGNATHIHHGTEPCDCKDDHEPTPTPLASSGFPVNSANATTRAQPSSGAPINSANATTSAYTTGTGYPALRPSNATITTVPLTRVSGGYIPIQHNFTIPYLNPHCPGNKTHVHHGTEPCDCHDYDEPKPLPSSGFPINSANATTTSRPMTASPVSRPSSGVPLNSANATTSAFMTGTGPAPTRVPLISVSGGYIPMLHNITAPCYNTHCPDNPEHVHHGTEPCDCIDEPTHRPSSGVPINSANATTTPLVYPRPTPSSGRLLNSANSTTSRYLTGSAPRPTTVPLMTVSGGYIPIMTNFSGPYINTHCPNNPHHVHHGTEPCDCVDEPTARPSSGMPINSANATATRRSTAPLTTGGSTTSNTTSAAPYPTNTLCPDSDGSTINDGHGASYLVTCNTVFTGVQLTIPISLRLRLRQVGDASGTCMALCDKEDSCLGTNVYANNTCEYFSEIDDFVGSSGNIALAKISGPPAYTSTSASAAPSNSANATAPVTTKPANATSIAVIPLKSVSGGYIPIPANVSLLYVNTNCPGNKTHVHHGTEPCDCDDKPTPAPQPVPSRGFTVSANTTTPAPGSTAYPGTISHSVPSPHTAPPAINLTSVSGGYIPIQANFTGSYLNTHCPGNRTHVHHGTEPCDCGEDDHLPTAYPSFGFPRPSANATTTASTPVETTTLASGGSAYSVVSSTTTSSLAIPTSTYPPVCPGYDEKSFTDGSDADYTLNCDTVYTGTILIPSYQHRALTDSAQECMAECDGFDACIAITFAPGLCTLFSAVNGTAVSTGSVAALKAAQSATISITSVGTSTSSATGVSTISATASTTLAPIISLISVSGGYIPYDRNLAGPYLNTHCPGNTTHVHHGTEPCNCDLDLPTAGFGQPPTSSAALASPTEPGTTTSVSATQAAPVTTSVPMSTITSSTSSVTTSSSSTSSSTSTFVSSAVTTSAPIVSLTSVLGGIIPVDPHFTGSFLNTLCVSNQTHIHRGTEPCDCGLDTPTTMAFHADLSTAAAISASTTQTPSTSIRPAGISATTSISASTSPSPSQSLSSTHIEIHSFSSTGATVKATDYPVQTSTKDLPKPSSTQSRPEEWPGYGSFPWFPKPSTSTKLSTLTKSTIKPTTTNAKPTTTSKTSAQPTTSSKVVPVASSSKPAPIPDSYKAITTSSKATPLASSSKQAPAPEPYKATTSSKATPSPSSSSSSSSSSKSTATPESYKATTSTKSAPAQSSSKSASTSQPSSSSRDVFVHPSSTDKPAVPEYSAPPFLAHSSSTKNVVIQPSTSSRPPVPQYTAPAPSSSSAVPKAYTSSSTLSSSSSSDSTKSGNSSIVSSTSTHSQTSSMNSPSSNIPAATPPAYNPTVAAVPTSPISTSTSTSTTAKPSSTFSTMTKSSTPTLAPEKPAQAQPTPANDPNWWQVWWTNVFKWFGTKSQAQSQAQAKPPPTYGRFGYGYAKAKARKE